MGDGALIMLSSIWVATTTGLPNCRAARTMRFCASGTSSGGSSTPRSPRATITASVRCMIASRFSSACGFSSLTMTQARSPISCFASATSSGRCTKDSADVVGAVLQREGEVVAVLRGQRRDRQHDVRHIDALVVRQRPADQHLGFQRVAALACNAQPELAVVQQQRAADRGRLDDLRMRQVDAQALARRRIEVELEWLAGLQMHPPAAKPPDAQLGSLHIGQDADRAVEPVLQLADHREAGGVVLVRAVAEIEPEHVGAGLEQRASAPRARNWRGRASR